MEQQLALCPWWTTADLIFRGECRGVVQHCDDLCEELVQRRFGGGAAGNGSFSAAAFARWAYAMGLAATPSLPEPGTAALLLGGPRSYMALLACVAIDAVGIVDIVLPIIPEAFDLLWAPAAGAAVQLIFGAPVLSLAVAAEEFLPYLDLLPGASFAWMLYSSWAVWPQEKNKTPSEVEGVTEPDSNELVPTGAAQPLDFFALDVATHVLHTYLLTAALLMRPSLATFAVELATAALFALGLALPDAALAAVTDQMNTIGELVQELRIGDLSEW